MAYQVKRLKKINETLELVADDGTITAITTDLTVDDVAKDFRECQIKILHAQQEIKKTENIKLAQEQLGNAIIELLTLIFGDVQAKKILEFYKGNYTEMATEITPFITSIIKPAIDEAVLERKKSMAKNLNFSASQKRKLKI